MKIGVVVGNPKKNSRALEATFLLAQQIEGKSDYVLDLADLGANLLEFRNDRVLQSIEGVLANDLTIIASPANKATNTGLIRMFLDQMPPICLR